jgi:hypothetical protein
VKIMCLVAFDNEESGLSKHVVIFNVFRCSLNNKNDNDLVEEDYY